MGKSLPGRPRARRGHWIRTLLVGVLGCLAAAGVAQTASGQEVILDSDRAALFPGLRERMAPPRPGVPPGTVVFRVREVFNLQGNNPFHRTEPLLNYNGQVVKSVSELLALVRGGTTTGGGDSGIGRPFTCSPSSVSATTADFRLGFDMNALGNQCSVAITGGAGFIPRYYVSNLYLGTGAPAGTVFIGTYPIEASSGTQLVGVPAAFTAFVHPGMGPGYTARPGTYQITIRDVSSRKQWRVQFTIAGVGTNDFFYFRTVTHTVNQVTRLS
jgi:hypothetical protein